MTTPDKQATDLGNTTTHVSPVNTPVSRDEALATIFGVKPRQLPLKFNGVDIILSEPDVSNALDATSADTDRKVATANMLVRYVCLPDGTQLFSEEHVDSIMGMPFNKDFQDLTGKINELLGVAVTTTDKAAFPEE